MNEREFRSHKLDRRVAVRMNLVWTKCTICANCILPLRSVFMKTISSTEARQNFGLFLDTGSKEILVVKRQNREIGAFIPMKELEKLQKLRDREFKKAVKMLSEEAGASGLTGEKLEAILAEINPS